MTPPKKKGPSQNDSGNKPGITTKGWKALVLQQTQKQPEAHQESREWGGVPCLGARPASQGDTGGVARTGNRGPQDLIIFKTLPGALREGACTGCSDHENFLLYPICVYSPELARIWSGTEHGLCTQILYFKSFMT